MQCLLSYVFEEQCQWILWLIWYRALIVLYLQGLCIFFKQFFTLVIYLFITFLLRQEFQWNSCWDYTVNLVEFVTCLHVWCLSGCWNAMMRCICLPFIRMKGKAMLKILKLVDLPTCVKFNCSQRKCQDIH